MPRPFLTARWESLVLLNYDCPAELLVPRVPSGTALDRWRDRTIVSLVGFRFVDTRVRGCAVPFHRDFEEVNLRFYVRRAVAGGAPRRAVVFVLELVPRAAIAFVARRVYGEPYLAVPMTHRVALTPEAGGEAGYHWRHGGAEFALGARAGGAAAPAPAGSEAEFITEHYWGYTRRRDGGTSEYQVEHPRWAVWEARDARFEGPAERLYGSAFARVLDAPPRSAFVAVGSEVAVHAGRRLTPAEQGASSPARVA